MTRVGAGLLSVVGGWMGVASPLTAPLDSGLRRNDDGGGPACLSVGWWLDGVLPHPSPPLWIPAFAGMTSGGGPV